MATVLFFQFFLDDVIQSQISGLSLKYRILKKRSPYFRKVFVKKCVKSDSSVKNWRSYLKKSHQTAIPRLPDVGPVPVAREKEVATDEHLDVHIDGNHSTGTGHVVNENHQLHPALELIGLITMQHLCEFTVFGKEQSQYKDITDWDPKAKLWVVFVLLHEEICAIAEVKVRHNGRKGCQSIHHLVQFQRLRNGVCCLWHRRVEGVTSTH